LAKKKKMDDAVAVPACGGDAVDDDGLFYRLQLRAMQSAMPMPWNGFMSSASVDWIGWTSVRLSVRLARWSGRVFKEPRFHTRPARQRWVTPLEREGANALPAPETIALVDAGRTTTRPFPLVRMLFVFEIRTGPEVFVF
jgi:hypothetical protein